MKTLQWQEPASYRRTLYYAEERRRPLRSVAVFAAVFAAMCLFRLVIRSGADAHPPPWPQSAAIAAVFAVVAAYGLPALFSFLPTSIVILSDKGVNNNFLGPTGWTIRFWSWQQIGYLRRLTQTAGGRTYSVLCLHGSGGEELATLAVGDSVSIVDLEVYVASYGKRVVDGRGSALA